MKVLARRQVLRGASGFTLGLPLLPSLLVPRGAYGAQVTAARRPRFVAFTSDHGAIKGPNMYPGDAALTQSAAMFTGHDIRWGRLQRQIDGTDAVLSPVLRAPSSELTDRLVSQLNVLRGFDIPFHLGHHTGGHLGYFSDGSGDPDHAYLQTVPTATIDQVMAWSPSFYADLTGIRMRSMVGGVRAGFSWNYSNPASRTGAIQQVRQETSTLTLFNQLFVPAAPAGANPRKPIVDHVLDAYRGLRQGNRRLATADRQRLDDHMARLAELQRRLSVAPTGSCRTVSKPTVDATSFKAAYNHPDQAKARYQLYNDVIAAAFMCGTTRIATFNVWDTFSDFAGDWHQDVAHQATAKQALMVAALQGVFRNVFLDLLRKLDVEETPGTTYLDNTLVQWTQEAGTVTHYQAGVPLITAGGAAGFFKTGLYVDLRNRAVTSGIRDVGSAFEQAGLTYQRWLATVLQAMGVPRSEFESGGVQGYGPSWLGRYYKNVYVPGVVETASQVPSVIRA